MMIEQLRWQPDGGWSLGPGPQPTLSAQFVLYFGSAGAIAASEAPRTLTERFPQALLLGCSTSLAITGDELDYDGVVAVACGFRRTRLRLAETSLADVSCSQEAGRQLGEALATPVDGQALAGVILLSGGVDVDGDGLARALQHAVGGHVPISGGLAGDGACFKHTLVCAGSEARTRSAAALGLYGPAVRLTHGTAGGWDRFGPYRRITRAAGCEIMELDGRPALDLYERYLGEEAAGLPGTALLFPLLVWDPEAPDRTQVRTVLGIDRARGSMTFAGSVPEGWGAQLMRGHLDRLIDGAAHAGELAQARSDPLAGDQLALLVSCVGRHLLLGQRVDEELLAVTAALGGMTRIGFYSHGEISPDPRSGLATLQNQSMVVTLLAELP